MSDIFSGFFNDDVDDVIDGDKTNDLIFTINDRHCGKVITFEHVSDFFLVIINITCDKVTVHNL